MRLEQRRLVDEALTSEEPCLGAVFCSYTFDPAYFEEHVLRAVLRLSGDPEEDAARYHEEALRALQETPVACIVDASVRQPGRRLPYDVHLVRRRTFHPKVFVVLFETEARLAIGSGNVTKAGLEQNTELFLLRRLRYDDAADAALLAEVDAFLGQCQELSGTQGTQLALLRGALANRLAGAQALDGRSVRDVAFVSSFGGSLLRHLDASIHPAAKITRVGVLAPFFEQDDLAAAHATDGLGALLGELLALRPSKDVMLDLGVPWDDAPLMPPASGADVSLDAGLGRLWAWRQRDETGAKPAELVEYFTLVGATARRVEGIRSSGEKCRFDREECEQALAEGRLWATSRPTVYAPKTILGRLAEAHGVQLWLHPSSELAPSGRISRRPLHAKAVLVTATYRGRTHTHALIGSANASRAALARGVEEGGNVEACVVCRFEGDVTLRDLLPALVRFSMEGVELTERQAIQADIDLSSWIEDVVHDAAARTLTVQWRANEAVPLDSWELRYLERRLASGNRPPELVTVVDGFDLQAGSAELTLLAGGGEWQVPIRVADLAALPTHPDLSQLGIRELLALLGRRLGQERMATVRARRGPGALDSVLDAVFGEGFGPTDVFKAWWGGVEDLKLAASFAAFRHRLLGAAGLMTAWKHLNEAPERLLSRDEIWVYGCELLRELALLELEPGPDTALKQDLLAEAVVSVTKDLEGIAPTGADHPWLRVVEEFYGVGGARA